MKNKESDFDEVPDEPIEDDGLDEVERIRLAMANEKKKA